MTPSPDELQEALDDRALQQEIRDLVASKYWKLLRVFLLNRRMQLFHADPQDNRQLWKNRGALEEVNRLLTAPEQALFEFAKTKLAGAVLPEEMRPLWLGGTNG